MVVKIKDSFNRADANTLGSAETGQKWESETGTEWGIRSNRAQSLSGNMLAFLESGVSDCIISVDLVNKLSGNGLIFRATRGKGIDWDDGFDLQILGSNITLYRMDTWGEIASIQNYGNFTTLKVELQGTSIKLYLDNVLKTTITNTHNVNATMHGILTGSAGAIFDNFLIEDFNNQTIHTTSFNTKAKGKLTVTATVEKPTTIHTTSFHTKGIGSLTANSQTTKNTNLSLKGKGTFTANPHTTKTHTSSLHIKGGAVININSKRTQNSHVALIGKGLITATPIKLINSSLTLKAKGSLSAQGKLIKLSRVNLKGSAQLSITATIQRNAQFNVTGKGILHINNSNVKVITASLNLKAKGRLNLTPLRLVHLSAVFTGKGTLSTSGQRTQQATSSLTGQGKLSLNGHKIVSANIHLIGKGILLIVDGEPIIGTIQLHGKRELYVYVKAKQDLTVNLKGKQELTIHLKGGLNVTMENQNFSMYAGDSKFVTFPVEGVESLSGSTLKWGIRKNKYSVENILMKTTNDGITFMDDKIQIKLVPEDTQTLSGTYYQECELTDTLGHVSTVFVGMVTINKSAV